MDVSLARRAGARIAVTGAAASSPAARSLLRAELDGVRLLPQDGSAGDDPNDVLRDTDMLVFVVDADDVPDVPRSEALAEAARDRGILVAAIVAAQDGFLGRSPLLAALRDAADMVMIVRDAGAIPAVVAALR